MNKNNLKLLKQISNIDLELDSKIVSNTHKIEKILKKMNMNELAIKRLELFDKLKTLFLDSEEYKETLKEIESVEADFKKITRSREKYYLL